MRRGRLPPALHLRESQGCKPMGLGAVSERQDQDGQCRDEGTEPRRQARERRKLVAVEVSVNCAENTSYLRTTGICAEIADPRQTC